MKKFFASILILASLVFTQVGCSKLKKVGNAVDSTPRIAGQLETLVDNIIHFTKEGKIPRSVEVEFLTHIRTKANPLIKEYIEFVAQLPRGVVPPPDKFAEAQRLFRLASRAISEGFVILKVLTREQGDLIKFAVDAIIDTINIIRDGFGVADDYFKAREVLWATAS